MSERPSMNQKCSHKLNHKNNKNVTERISDIKLLELNIYALEVISIVVVCVS